MEVDKRGEREKREEKGEGLKEGRGRVGTCGVSGEE